MSERTRRRLTTACIVAGAFALLLALPLAYLDRNLFQPAGFAQNAANAVQNDAVRARLARELTDSAVAANPRLVAIAPLISQVADDALDTPLAATVVRKAAVQTHNALFSRDKGSIVVDLANVGIIAGQFLKTQDPVLAERFQNAERIIVPVADRSLATQLASFGESVAVLALVLPLLALVLFGAALWLSPLRRGAAFSIGLALVGVAAVSLVGNILLRFFIVRGFSGDAAGVARGVADAYLGAYVWWCIALGLAGAIVAGSAASVIREIDPARLPRRIWEWITRPRSKRWQEVIGALVLIVTGLSVIGDPLGTVRVAIVLFGCWMVFAGVVTLLRMIVGPQPTPEQIPSMHQVERRFVPWLVGALTLVGITVAAVALVVSGRAKDAPAIAASTGCNGYAELCAKRFDEVTLPTAHNAMSSAQDGFYNANHGITLTRQLDLGVRGLLVDAYLGRRNDNGVVRTDLAEKAVAPVEAKIGAAGLAAAQRLAGSVAFGPIKGDKQLYFCHIICELGAIEGQKFLGLVKDWLDRNPSEVLSIIVEDAAPTADIVKAFEDAGLARDASDFQPAPGRPFPTLREMIDSGRRLWVAAEEKGLPNSWYHQAYKVTQETPYNFSKPAQLRTKASCAPGRGPSTAPLFLVNSWVEAYPPNPKYADVVNQRAFLLERARRCARLRKLTVNLLAVDFAGRGDVVGAAAVLNGVAP